MSRSSCIDIIFVPQGSELRAVQRGVNRSQKRVVLCAIPMGPCAVTDYLERWLKTDLKAFESPPTVLLMGLCGSVSPSLGIGDWVLYENCTDDGSVRSVPPVSLACDAALKTTLQERLGDAVTIVTAATCDRLIHRAVDKQALAQRYGVQTVDMEGYAFLKALESTPISVGMLRVVSDDSCHDLPDLSTAMTQAGTLDPIKLAVSMVTQPRSALRLIQGSLRSLKQLENATARLLM
jgi:nucleoside phosphorylase